MRTRGEREEERDVLLHCIGVGCKILREDYLLTLLYVIPVRIWAV